MRPWILAKRRLPHLVVLSAMIFALPTMAAAQEIGLPTLPLINIDVGSSGPEAIFVSVLKIILGVLFFCYAIHYVQGHYLHKHKGGSYDHRELASKMKKEAKWGLVMVLAAGFLVSPAVHYLVQIIPIRISL